MTTSASDGAIKRYVLARCPEKAYNIVKIVELYRLLEEDKKNSKTGERSTKKKSTKKKSSKKSSKAEIRRVDPKDCPRVVKACPRVVIDERLL